MEQNSEAPPEDGVVSVRTMEIVVALLFIAAGAVVIFDSLRIGVGWKELEGPAAGYFPFYIGLFIIAASAVTLARACLLGKARSQAFVGAYAVRQVLLVLIPLTGYVIFIAFMGIYVASAIYIGLFMAYFGRYGWKVFVPVGVGVAVALFFTFEVWFLIPLPKGPLEDLLGY